MTEQDILNKIKEPSFLNFQSNDGILSFLFKNKDKLKLLTDEEIYFVLQNSDLSIQNKEQAPIQEAFHYKVKLSKENWSYLVQNSPLTPGKEYKNSNGKKAHYLPLMSMIYFQLGEKELGTEAYQIMLDSAVHLNQKCYNCIVKADPNPLDDEFMAKSRKKYNKGLDKFVEQLKELKTEAENRNKKNKIKI